MADAPTTAYTEVQIDDDSISLTLISESGSSGPVIEDTERFTFEELQDMAGEHLTLRLSTDSREALSEQREEAIVGNLLQSSRSQTSSHSDKVEDLNKSDNLEDRSEIISDNPSEKELLAYMGMLGGEATDGQDSVENLPEVGQIVRDNRPPEWSQDNRLEVVNISDESASEHVIEERVGHLPDETVFDANPHCGSGETVVEARYLSGNNKTYAFPLSRLDW